MTRMQRYYAIGAAVLALYAAAIAYIAHGAKPVPIPDSPPYHCDAPLLALRCSYLAQHGASEHSTVSVSYSK